MARMHEDEIAVDAALAERLIAEQFPQWADLPLRPWSHKAPTTRSSGSARSSSRRSCPRRHGGVEDARRRCARFRDLPEVDDATWRRGRGWLLSRAVMILSYYTPETNRVLVEEADRWLRALKDDPL